MVHFLPLGWRFPRIIRTGSDISRCTSGRRTADYSDIAEITLINPGDILFLYTDGVYDGSDEEVRRDLEELMGDRCLLSAKDICNAMLE